MAKPAPVLKSGVALPLTEGVSFSTVVELNRAHGIERGATIKIESSRCIDGFFDRYIWEAERPIRAADIVTGSSGRTYLKLSVRLKIDLTDEGCEEEKGNGALSLVGPTGPGSVTVTITNPPPGGSPPSTPPEEGPPEEIDPIYFP